MANGPTTPAKDVVGTKAALDKFTRQILAVPHSEIKAQLDAEKAAGRTVSRRLFGARHVSRPKS
jgi:hypothetical protein